MECPTCGQKVSVHEGVEGTGSYVPEERNAALEEAAKVADEAQERLSLFSKDPSFCNRVDEAGFLASKIRKLKEKK